MVAIALTPCAVAAIWASPLVRAFTTPAFETTATLVSLLDQNTCCPRTMLPDSSRGSAVNVMTDPTGTVDADGVTSTVATRDTSVAARSRHDAAPPASAQSARAALSDDA